MCILVISNVPVPFAHPDKLGFNVKVPALLLASGCIAPVMLNMIAPPPLGFSEPLSWRFDIASPPGKITWPLSVVPLREPVGKQPDSCRTLLTVAFKVLPFCWRLTNKTACSPCCPAWAVVLVITACHVPVAVLGDDMLPQPNIVTENNSRLIFSTRIIRSPSNAM